MLELDVVYHGSETTPARLDQLFSTTSYSVNAIQLDDYLDNCINTSLVDSQAGILYVTASNLKQVSSLVETHDLLFSLLISNTESVLKERPLLSRCTDILVLPVDDEILLTAISGVITPEEDFDQLIALAMNFVGASPEVRDLINVVGQVSKYDAPILVHGETGTGKELVARGIHYESMRRDFPFVPVNCGALTDDLLLSELFGYEPGAFTDAKKQHAGLVTQASRGTLFLDEVDSLSGKAQAALLRFMQDQEYRPLGSEQIFRSDVRVICATNKNLGLLVNREEFREDLYYRLKILDVKTPSLKDRRTDIPLLIEHFFKEFARKYNEPLKLLHPLTERWMVYDYDWPGNVRELENYLHKIFILSNNRSVYVPDILGRPVDFKSRHAGPGPHNRAGQEIGYFQEEKTLLVNRFEREYLQALMEKTAGNVSRAARMSGKERRALGKLLKKHGIKTEDYKGVQNGITHSR